MHDQPPRISMGVCSPSAEPKVFKDDVLGTSFDNSCGEGLPDLSKETVLDPVQLGAMFCNSFLKCRTGLSPVYQVEP